MIANLVPNWTTTLSSKKAIEREFPTIKFTGPGWYISTNEHLLIVSLEDRDDPFIQNVEGKFTVYCYEPNISQILGAISHAPVRQDVSK